MSVLEENTINTVNYFGIESYDNAAYNWCSNILCNSTICSTIQKDDSKEVSFSKLKKRCLP